MAIQFALFSCIFVTPCEDSKGTHCCIKIWVKDEIAELEKGLWNREIMFRGIQPNWCILQVRLGWLSIDTVEKCVQDEGT